MNVLITGSNGFIGRALCNRMVEDGCSFIRGVRKNAENKTRTVVYGDIHGDTNWSDALRNCSGVIHLAARVHVMRDNTPEPLSAFRTVNTDGTLHLARQAAAAGVHRFVFVSSIGVNGSESFQVPFNLT